jgi:hypothetical protein
METVLRKRLQFEPHRLQLVKQLSGNDRMKPKAFCEVTIERFEIDKISGDYHIFRDEATFCFLEK